MQIKKRCKLARGVILNRCKTGAEYNNFHERTKTYLRLCNQSQYWKHTIATDSECIYKMQVIKM
jgi:hypothetical protein